MFGLTLSITLLAGLAWVFSRPAEYEATARWHVDFPAPPPLAASAAAPTSADLAALPTELQILTSRPLLDKLLAQMRSASAIPSNLAPDPVTGLQHMLEVAAQPAMPVVTLRAHGPDPEPLAPILNTLFEVYRRDLAERYRDDSADTLARARDEAQQLQARVQQRRQAVDGFRARHDIVSLERDENAVLSQVRGQGQAMNAAQEKLVAAEARLRALREALEAGRSVVRAREHPTVASLEQRISQAREEQRELERGFTEAYLAMDPRARALRARIANLEEQLVRAREAAARAAVAEAEEEVEGARAAVARLSQQAAGARQNVQAFTARFAEYKSMTEELARLESLHTAAQARVAELEGSALSRAPSVRLIEPAARPDRPFRPDYARDAMIAVAGSLVFALLTVAVVEYLRRPDPTPAPAPAVIVERPWWPSLAAGPRPPALDLHGATPAVAGSAQPAGLLPGAMSLPRELAPPELAALIGAAAAADRPALVALLCGLAPDELAALRWRDVDLAAGTWQHGQHAAAARPLLAPLRALLAAQVESVTTLDAAVFAAGADGLDARVLVAAHDAGLERPGEVDAAALRHTFVAHLVRQGLRFAELTALVGALSPQALNAYGTLAPPGPKRPLAEVDPVLPALRGFAAG